RVFVFVFIRFAEREAEMIAINVTSGRRSLLGSHARDLVLGKAIRLEISQAPISITETGLDRRCRVIARNSFFLLAHTLKSMAERHMQFGRAGRAREQPPVDFDCRLMSSKADAGNRVKRKNIPVARLEFQ